MSEKRVVITGIGVVAPNGVGTDSFNSALREGKSGIRHWPELEELNFRCQIGGIPAVSQEMIEEKLPKFIASKITNKTILYGCIAGLEAWRDAGLEVENSRKPQMGAVFGSGAPGLDTFIIKHLANIDAGNNKALGTIAIPESMSSGPSAYLNGILGFGSRVMSNSSACITGSESVSLGYELIKSGKATTVLSGSTEGDGRYIWGAFDAMRILCSVSNDKPEEASRPMSEKPMGFVPAGGSGALVLEELESAQARGARIYAEILAAHFNTGGQTNGGSMTAPNSEVVQECIKAAVLEAKIDPSEIDLITGHLTSTRGDSVEIKNWSEALGLSGDAFPYINTPKSMIGHCVAGAGSIELVADVLQMEHGYIHRNLNLKPIHPAISEIVPADKIPTSTIEKPINTIIKANFGFGDLNCVIVLRKWK